MWYEDFSVFSACSATQIFDKNPALTVCCGNTWAMSCGLQAHLAAMRRLFHFLVVRRLTPYLAATGRRFILHPPHHFFSTANRQFGILIAVHLYANSSFTDLREENNLEQINFEMQYISKLSFCQKMRFSAEPTPRCGALHSCAASGHLNFFKVKMLYWNTIPASERCTEPPRICKF